MYHSTQSRSDSQILFNFKLQKGILASFVLLSGSLHTYDCSKLVLQRCKHFEIGGDKKGKGTSLF